MSSLQLAPSGRQPGDARTVYRRPLPRKGLRGLVQVLLDHLTIWNTERQSRKYSKAGRRPLAVYTFDWIGIRINVEGLYEQELLDIVFEWLGKHADRLKRSAAIDAGANIGNHSVYFSDHFAEVLSFEPNARTFKLLHWNAELAENISCFNVGLSNTAETAKLNLLEGNTGGASLKRAAAAGQTVDIELARLDDAVQTGLPIALIKIDVEGWEYEVLEGGEKTIAKHRPLILFEQSYGEFSDGTTRSIELLRKWGYTDFACVEQRPRPPEWLPKFARRIVRFTLRAWAGESSEIVAHARFPHRTYNFVIAIPDWIGKG
jgi:FkbM family methyltransferase